MTVTAPTSKMGHLGSGQVKLFRTFNLDDHIAREHR
jgi:hypothetical protein